jgi:hypothetical protein
MFIIFYNFRIIILQCNKVLKVITKKVCLVVLHGLAAANGSLGGLDLRGKVCSKKTST